MKTTTVNPIDLPRPSGRAKKKQIHARRPATLWGYPVSQLANSGHGEPTGLVLAELVVTFSLSSKPKPEPKP